MNKKAHILILTRYSPTGASSRVRSFQYLPYLSENGVETSVSFLFGDDYLNCLYNSNKKPVSTVIGAYFKRAVRLLSSRRFDLVHIEKELFPWLPGWFESALAAMKVKYCLDYDDAIFHKYDMHKSRAVRRLLGDKIDRIVRNAILVTVGNEYLAQHMINAGARKVVIVPSVVDTDRYTVAAGAENDPLVIGWIGTPYTAVYLDLLKPVLKELASEKCRLLLVGAGKVDFEGVPVEVREWSEENEVSDIQCMDVGIMPLRNTLWEEGKCGYKLIQYMACGLPVIASPTSANRNIIDDGVNGFLASTAEDWLRAFYILKDGETRKKMGSSGRKKVEERYSIKVTSPALLDLLLEAAGK